MKLILVCFFRCFVFVFSCQLASAYNEPPEKLLMENLFKNYNRLVRPNKNPDEPVNVTIGMTIESLADIDDQAGTITISGWIDMTWKDEYMCWDPSDYGNISFFTAPAERFWRPDLAFKSAIGERFFTPKDQVIAVTSDCMVEFSPGGRSTHSCDLDVTLFPFDSQVCHFVILTWFSSSSYIRLVEHDLSCNKTKDNKVWKIVKTESSVLTEGDNAYGAVTFSLHISRKPFYYILYVMLPLALLAALNLMVFRLPTESDEKITLSINLLLSFSIWLLTLNNLTPQSSDSIPILGVFITLLMLLSAISVIMTVYVLRIHHNDKNRQVPPLARRLVLMWKAGIKLKKTKNVGNKNSSDLLVSWRVVAETLDSFAFVVISSMTALMTALCALCILALKSQHPG